VELSPCLHIPSKRSFKHAYHTPRLAIFRDLMYWLISLNNKAV